MLYKWSDSSGFPPSLSEWSFTICSTPCNTSRVFWWVVKTPHFVLGLSPLYKIALLTSLPPTHLLNPPTHLLNPPTHLLNPPAQQTKLKSENLKLSNTQYKTNKRNIKNTPKTPKAITKTTTTTTRSTRCKTCNLAKINNSNIIFQWWYLTYWSKQQFHTVISRTLSLQAKADTYRHYLCITTL